MSYVLDLPNLPTWTANDRGHWSQRAETVAWWRSLTAQAARKAQLPTLGRVAVTLAMTPADRRRRDPDGLAGALKPALDGLVDAGVIADDSWRQVASVTLRIDAPQPSRSEHGWRLFVVEVAADAA